ETYEKSDIGWNIYPQGIYHVLMGLKKYKKMVYITENGIADAKDTKRALFIQTHLYWVHRAMAMGIPVMGYFYWSLTDNYEWMRGYSQRFGLIEINYSSLRRTIRPSAYEYKKICDTNTLEVNLENV
ncbi:family 1 glycosylhydrolase, partial [Candidatus Parcubacteria bacterium]|nr:family 1 glycosylhydrolase [Candidatus Parcubacteria bacterium]